MNRIIKIFSTNQVLAESLAHDIVNKITEGLREKQIFTIALSGGTTPGILFSILGDHFASSVNWKQVHFFWVDERCVPPDDPESNYGMVKAAFLNKIDIPEENIYRIKGEDEPENEVIRYSHELNDFTCKRNGLPSFDITLLGLGEDGHVASIFPGSEDLFSTLKFCLVSIHPLSRQKRITLSGMLINNSLNIFFMVTGKGKAFIVRNILSGRSSGKQYPASYVVSETGATFWYIDEQAGSMIRK